MKEEVRKISIIGLITTVVMMIIVATILPMTQPRLDEDGKIPLDKTTESFGKASDWFFQRFGDADWIGIHSNSYGYSIAILFENAGAYVIFALENDEWKWVGLAPYYKPVDLEKMKQEIIDALIEQERKRQFEKLNNELGINTL
jgi:hypothetical protein